MAEFVILGIAANQLRELPTVFALLVIPATAGTQAGSTVLWTLGPCFRGDDYEKRRSASPEPINSERVRCRFSQLAECNLSCLPRVIA
jgi:hypothetical protein